MCYYYHAICTRCPQQEHHLFDKCMGATLPVATSHVMFDVCANRMIPKLIFIGRGLTKKKKDLSRGLMNCCSSISVGSQEAQNFG